MLCVVTVVLHAVQRVVLNVVQRVVLHAVQRVVLRVVLHAVQRVVLRAHRFEISERSASVTDVFFKTFLLTCVATRNSVSCSVNVLFLNTIQSLPVQIYFSDFANW